MKPKRVMRLKPRGGASEETKEIGGISKEEEWGYQIRGTKGEELGYFGADKYETITFEIWWPDPPSPR
jgi:hypothetical protein